MTRITHTHSATILNGAGITLPVIEQRPTRVVNCGSCNACCRGDVIYMHPECGDDISTYETEMYGARRILKHKKNDDCIYLDREKGW